MEQTKKFISKSDLGIALTTPLSRLSASFIMMLCGFNRINDLLSDYSTSDTNAIVSEILKRLDIAVNVFDGGRSEIPKTGGFIAVVNYPHGVLDVLAIAHVIRKVRPDARFLLKNELFNLSVVEELALISSKEPISDATLVRAAIDHVKSGHPLIVFPADKSASYSKGFGRVVDAQWSQTAFKIAKLVDVPIQSYFISGRNTNFYLSLRKLSGAISSAMIVREMFAQQFSDITVVISDLFEYGDIVDQTCSNLLKSSQKDAIVANYSRALTFMQAQKVDMPKSVKNTPHANKHVVIKNKIILFENGEYNASINSEQTEVVYEKGKKQILTFTIAKIEKGHYADANWFSNFDLSRTASALIESDAIEIFNISYLQNWNYKDVKFIAESFKYLAREFGVGNIIIQDTKKYYYSQSTAYTLLNHYLEKNCVQKMCNRFVVPRSPSSSLKTISRRMAYEVLNFPNVTLFVDEIKKTFPIEISPLIPAIIQAGGKYVASASPMSRTIESEPLRGEKIKGSVTPPSIETISQSVNLMIIQL